MNINTYNTAVILNNKIATQCTSKRFYLIPESVILYAMRKLSAPALRLYLVLVGQKDGFTGAMKTYCTRANIKVNNYSKYRDELIKKGFLEFEAYKQMTVKVPHEAFEQVYDNSIIYIQTNLQDVVEEVYTKENTQKNEIIEEQTTEKNYSALI